MCAIEVFKYLNGVSPPDYEKYFKYPRNMKGELFIIKFKAACKDANFDLWYLTFSLHFVPVVVINLYVI